MPDISEAPYAPETKLIHHWPMSSGQQSLWFEQLAHPLSNAYNLGACLHFPKSLDQAALNHAIAALTPRHPVLRARFSSDQPFWRISDTPLVYMSLSPSPVTKSTGRELVAKMVRRPYVLAQEHPFRFALVALEDGGCLLGIACHHIVADLHSLAVLVRDMDQAFLREEDHTPVDGDALSMTANYADFCEWQTHMLRSNSAEKSAVYWRERLAEVRYDALAMQSQSHSALPTKNQAPPRINFSIPHELSCALTTIATQQSTTPFCFFLTTFQAFLAHRFRRNSVVVGTPVSGRNKKQFRNTIGYFVNLLPMSFTFNPDESFDAALTRNSAMTRSGLRHGQYPLAAIVDKLSCPAMPGTRPLIQATMTFQTTTFDLEDKLTRLALGLPGGALALAGQSGKRWVFRF